MEEEELGSSRVSSAIAATVGIFYTPVSENFLPSLEGNGGDRDLGGNLGRKTGGLLNW